jgi:hypothetical protein
MFIAEIAAGRARANTKRILLRKHDETQVGRASNVAQGLFNYGRRRRLRASAFAAPFIVRLLTIRITRNAGLHLNSEISVRNPSIHSVTCHHHRGSDYGIPQLLRFGNGWLRIILQFTATRRLAAIIRVTDILFIILSNIPMVYGNGEKVHPLNRFHL